MLHIDVWAWDPRLALKLNIIYDARQILNPLILLLYQLHETLIIASSILLSGTILLNLPNQLFESFRRDNPVIIEIPNLVIEPLLNLPDLLLNQTLLHLLYVPHDLIALTKWLCLNVFMFYQINGKGVSLIVIIVEEARGPAKNIFEAWLLVGFSMPQLLSEINIILWKFKVSRFESHSHLRVIFQETVQQFHGGDPHAEMLRVFYLDQLDYADQKLIHSLIWVRGEMGVLENSFEKLFCKRWERKFLWLFRQRSELQRDRINQFGLWGRVLVLVCRWLV